MAKIIPRLGILIAAIFCIAPEDLFGNPPYGSATKVWERHLGDDQWDRKPDTLAIASEDRYLWVAGTSTLSGSQGKSGRYWLWKMDGDGSRVREIFIERPNKEKRLNGAYSYVKTVLPVEGGELYVLLEFIEGEPWLIRLAENGVRLSEKRLADRDKPTVFRKLIRSGGKEFYAIGHQSGGGLVKKLDAGGNSLWEYTSDRQKTASFIDGLATGDGGIIAVENSQERLSGIGPSDIWITRLSGEGRIERSISFSGRHGCIVQRQNGGYLVVYDKAVTTSQDIRMKAVNWELEEEWESDLVGVDHGLDRFKVAAMPDGDYIVAASIETLLWVSQTDKFGKRLWTYRGTPEDKIRTCDSMQADGADFYIASAAIDFDKQALSLKRKVGVIKFTTQSRSTNRQH